MGWDSGWDSGWDCARADFPTERVLSRTPLIIRTVDQIVESQEFFFKEIFAEIRFDGTLGFTIFDRRQGFEMIADNGMIMG